MRSEEGRAQSRAGTREAGWCVPPSGTRCASGLRWRPARPPAPHPQGRVPTPSPRVLAGLVMLARPEPRSPLGRWHLSPGEKPHWGQRAPGVGPHPSSSCPASSSNPLPPPGLSFPFCEMGRGPPPVGAPFACHGGRPLSACFVHKARAVMTRVERCPFGYTAKICTPTAFRNVGRDPRRTAARRDSQSGGCVRGGVFILYSRRFLICYDKHELENKFRISRTNSPTKNGRGCRGWWEAPWLPPDYMLLFAKARGRADHPPACWVRREQRVQAINRSPQKCMVPLPRGPQSRQSHKDSKWGGGAGS